MHKIIYLIIGFLILCAPTYAQSPAANDYQFVVDQAIAHAEDKPAPPAGVAPIAKPMPAEQAEQLNAILGQHQQVDAVLKLQQENNNLRRDLAIARLFNALGLKEGRDRLQPTKEGWEVVTVEESKEEKK